MPSSSLCRQKRAFLVFLFSLLVCPPLEAQYLLGPGDVLEVLVWKYEDLSRVIAVDSDGTITVPLVGSIQAAAKSTREVRESITKELAKHITNPQVTVMIREYINNRVSVLGMVNRPGEYPIFGKTKHLLQILAMAGGLAPHAASNRVRIMRSEKEILVNVKKLLKIQGGVPIVLRPGDVVFVPKKKFDPNTIWKIVAAGGSAALIYRAFVLEK